MTLRSMIHDPSTPLSSIESWLDEHDAAERQAAMFSLDRKDQRALYQRCSESAALTPEHFVPAEVDDLQEVIHRGRNTLPVPSALRQFEKRFTRSPDQTRLAGYNEGVVRPFIGPGYFVAYPTTEPPEWCERGSIVVDYFNVPEGEVPTSWPSVVPNSRGLQFLVYNKTRDFLRRVSRHVSIGAAYKGEKALDQYFVLVRQDPQH